MSISRKLTAEINVTESKRRKSHNYIRSSYLNVMKFFVDSLGTPVEKDSTYAQKILKEYETKAIIKPPSVLSPLFISPSQTDESLKNMSIHYIKTRDDSEGGFNDKKADIQLFEIPPIPLDCLQYTSLGSMTFEKYNAIESSLEKPVIFPEEQWVKLPSTTDFSCHVDFEKIFLYSEVEMDGEILYRHHSRQWGDATVLSKHGGDTKEPYASEVWRTLSPLTSIISDSYEEISAIWIRKSKEKLPAPFFRWQSIKRGTKLLGEEDHKDYPDCTYSLEIFKTLYSESITARNQLRVKQQTATSASELTSHSLFAKAVAPHEEDLPSLKNIVVTSGS